MRIYLNCYVIGEGYTLKATRWPGPAGLERISRGAMPPQTGQAFARDKALLFWGELDGLRTGFVRDIPTALRDENGRKCCLHAAFSGEGPEDRTVDALMAWALERPAGFMTALAATVAYDGADYRLDGSAFSALAEFAQARASSGARAGALVPRTSAAAFWESCGVETPAALRTLSVEEWRRREFLMDVFFYCSTPNSGFVLRRVDPATGNTLAEGKAAFAGLLPSAQRILTHGGASMALFRENGRECFVAKNLKSAAPDSNGRYKTLSLVIQAGPESALIPAQMGAWGLLDRAALAEAATGCVEVYFGPEGYDVLPEPLSALLAKFSERIALPADCRYRDVWARIMSTPAFKPYRMLALEADMEYFCRVNELYVTEEQVGCLTSRDAVEGYAAAPLGLKFGPALYVPARAGTEEPQAKEKPEAKPKPDVEPEVKPRPEVRPKAEVKPEQKAKLQTETKPETKPKPETKLEIKLQAESRQKRKTEAKPRTESAPEDEEERIDLLEYKWFLPSVVGAGALIVAGVALWLRLHGH